MPARGYYCREDLIEAARLKILTALDEFAQEDMPDLISIGALDRDLPELFKAVDAQVDRLIERSGFLMPDLPYEPGFLMLTKKQYEAAMSRMAE